MSRKSQKPSWFKLWLHHKPLIDAVSDDVAGRVVKAAMHYFASGEVCLLGPVEAVVFASIKADIDSAQEEYLRDVQNGRKGGRSKQTDKVEAFGEMGNPPLPGVTQGDGDRDGDGDREADGDVEKKGNRAYKLPTRHRFSPPTVDEVKEYCREHGYAVDADRFVDHYESNGWMIGKSQMKDWKAAVRNWSRKEKNTYGKTGPEKAWPAIGTTV